MDAVSELHDALDPRVRTLLPMGIKARLEFALRRCKHNTLHSYRSWLT